MTKHITWDSQIGDQLNQLQIIYSENHKSLKPKITLSLRQYGFALLSGIGSNGNQETAASQLLSLCEELGTVLPQSPRSEKIEDIRDFSDVDDKDERGYRSRGELTPHSDPPTLIVLHCLQPAKSGGETYLVNVRKIHDAIANDDPELLDLLYQGFPHWNVEGQPQGPGPAPDLRPIFMARNGNVSCVHYRPFVEKAAQESGQALSSKQTAALDIFDRHANAAEFALRFYLKPGQSIILHNRTVLHARTDYVDWTDPDKRRHLLRCWIDAPELLSVSSEHELGNIFDK
jgi:alpha-ketoglutarate-dependent taurine dioxygenase